MPDSVSSSLLEALVEVPQALEEGPEISLLHVTNKLPVRLDLPPVNEEVIGVIAEEVADRWELHSDSGSHY